MKKRLLQLVVAVFSIIFIVGCSSTSALEKKEEESVEDGEVTLYIVRHGKTMLNTTDRVQGWSDAVLTAEGEKTVRYAGKGLKDIEFTAAYSSDSGRSVQTSNIILDENKKSDVTLQTDKRLREFNFGSYEGELNHTMWTDIAESQGKTLDEWMDEGISPKNFANSVAELDKGRVKEGENWPAEDYETIAKRLKESIDEIAEKESGKGDSNVLIVSHGLSIGVLVDILSEGYELPAGGLKNASVTTVKYKDGKYSIDKVGDLSYIEKGQE
ncbi:histidine phosphatase family protein [Oceanobacillus sp. J11TS1]|uniref:histidine phosphatase family protein n=1 Tax=Oceanobacillus sp. J11TS1 TaxID=2807191 RepID=UPI001B08AD3F|nr:histidine phosphatase family protein [Oceanobacillus sp. J11TS1]GIO24152.1 phosphoglycerate mutase [Oceanobacillus sp. J11TS1]